MKNDNTINPENYTAHLRPGKFEGESAETEYYYNHFLNGDGDVIWNDKDDTEASLFHIQSDEADAFNLPIGHYFLLWEDSQGFVYGEVYPSRTAADKAFTSKI